MGNLDSHQNMWFLGPIQAQNLNSISIGSAIFEQMTAECPYTLQWDTLSPLKIAPSHGDFDPHLTPVLNPNGISIASAVFAGLTSIFIIHTALFRGFIRNQLLP